MLFAAYGTVWNPKWRTAVGGGYVNVDYNGTATNIILSRTARGAGGLRCGAIRCRKPSRYHSATGQQLPARTTASGKRYTRTQSNPVPQLDIGLQVMYTPQQHRVQRPGGAGTGEHLRVPPSSTGSSTTKTSGPRCSAGSATSIHDRLSDPGKLQPPAVNRRGFCFGYTLLSPAWAVASALRLGADLFSDDPVYYYLRRDNVSTSEGVRLGMHAQLELQAWQNRQRPPGLATLLEARNFTPTGTFDPA